MSLATLQEDNLHFLRQGRTLLRAIDDRLFTATPSLPMSAVGGHFRHCTDFYDSFLDGLATGAVDYDARQRDPRLEVDRQYALDHLESLISRLSGLSELSDQPLRVSMDRAPAQPLDQSWAESSIERELQFLRSHTVHHYALIAAVLHLLGHPPDEDLGVAPATLAHRRQLVHR